MKLKLALAGLLMAVGLATPALAAPYGDYGQNTNQGNYQGDYDNDREDRRVAFPGRRHNAQWELIGAREVSFRAERDTILAQGRDRHRQVKICVYRAPVRMLDADVRFRNGGNQDLYVRDVLGAGQCTRAIDLSGRRRDIRSISFAYKTIPGFNFRRHGRTAIVQVYAR